MLELSVKSHFDAAHFLPGYTGDCAKTHGHTWTVEANWSVPDVVVNDIGIAIDFKELKIALNTVIGRLDHTTVNKIIVIPTAENIARYIFDTLASIDLGTSKDYIQSVTVYEGLDGSKCTYYFDVQEAEAEANLAAAGDK